MKAGITVKHAAEALKLIKEYQTDLLGRQNCSNKWNETFPGIPVEKVGYSFP